MSPRHIAVSALAALAITLTAGCAGTPTRESTGEYIDSSVVSNKVRAKILGADDVSILDIDVTTFRGVVQISGFVDSEAQRTRAAEIARTVEGVREVRNNIVVKPQ